MTNANHPRAIDYARMSRIVLGLLDDDIDRTNRALNEAAEEDSVHLLLAALVMCLVSAMKMPAVSPDGVRKAFEGTIVAIQMDGDSE